MENLTLKLNGNESEQVKLYKMNGIVSIYKSKSSTTIDKKVSIFAYI